MRYFSKFISAALILILAAACNTKEIDNPDNPDKPKAYDNIILTAGINQTRVDYSVVGSKLVPGWVEGDVIFGYFGSGDGSQIEFTVDDVKEDGTAVLEPGKGWDDFLQQFKSLEDGETLPIGLIYTGSEASYSPENPNDVIVSMKKQTGENIPACMHASRYIKDKDDEAQIIRFLFDNDCAIFEIESITGIAEDAGLTDVQTLSLTSLTVTNLIPTYEYSYASGVLSYNSGNGDPTSYTINLPEDAWEVDYEGNINHSADKNLLVAVAPNSENNILITATTEGGRQFSYLYYGKLDAGECYIIKKRDVVAKTEDGQYFTSVSAAFDHAEELSDRYTTAADNVVTLIKKEINGFGEQTALPTHTSTIEIDYPVTLDLNGCTLSLAEREEFYVELFTGEITIQDGTDEDNQVKYDGTISSTSGNPILWNCGTVNIHGGNLIYDGDNNLIHNLGTVNISDGFLKSYAESDEEIDEYYSVVHNEATLNIYGGTLNSVDCDTIRNTESGTVTIHGGEVYSKSRVALYSGSGSTTIIDGKDALIQSEAQSDYQAILVTSDSTTKPTSFDMSAGKVEGVFSAVMIDGNVSANISGGYIKSNVHHTLCVFNNTESKELNPSCIITGGVIHNTSNQSSANSAVYCFTRVKGDDGKKNLVVKWATGNEGDSKGLEQPILFSNKMYPIFAEYYQLNNNYAQIEVSGGYLYSTKAQASRCFYDERDETGDDGYYCLTIPENSSIYTNTNFMYFGTRRQAFSNYTQGGENTAVSITTKTISTFQELGSLSFTYCISTP